MNNIESNIKHLKEAKNSAPVALAIAGVVGIIAFAFGRKVMKKDMFSSALQASAIAATVLGAMKKDEVKALQKSY